MSVTASVLKAFCVTYMSSSEGVCMSRFSGFYGIISNSFLCLYEFGEGKVYVYQDLSFLLMQIKGRGERERWQNVTGAIFSFW